MNSHVRILNVALANLARERVKTVVIVAAYTLIVALVVSVLLLVKTLNRQAQLLLQDAPELVLQQVRGGRHELIPTALADGIRSIRGVGSVLPRVWGYSYDPPTGATFTFWGADSVPTSSLEIIEGELPMAENDNVCLIGQGVAEIRFLGVGDRLPIKGAGGEIFAPRVVGLFTTDSTLLTNDLVVIPTGTLREIFGIPDDLSTDLVADVFNPEEINTVAAKIQAQWPDVRTVSRDQILQTYDAVFNWRGGVWLALLSTSVLAFGILVWDKASGLSAEEYRNIGVLKALGWSTSDVLQLKLWEGVIVSTVSVITGVVAAQLHLIVFNGGLFATVMKGWSVLYPSFESAPSLDAYLLLICLPVAVVPYVMASLVPSWRAAITDPDSVIRS